MAWRALLAASLASCLATAAAAPAAQPDDDIEFVVSLSVDPATCNLRVARQVALARVVRNYAALRGECLAVRGWRFGRAIYPSAEAARSVSPVADRIHEAVGLYGEESLLHPGPAAPVRVAVAGVAGGCEFLPYGSAGYCHSTLEGGFLIMGEIRRRR